MTWRPLYSGDEAVAIRAVIGEIAEALAAAPAMGRDPAIADGAAGEALLFAYLAHDGGDDRWWALAGERLEAAVRWREGRSAAGGSGDAMTAAPLGLLGGGLGVAWVAAHLAAGDGADDVLARSDARVAEALAAPRWEQDRDLVSGLAGMAVYALERGEAGVAAGERIVEHLAALADVDSDGIAWFTPPALVPPTQRGRCPDGYYNLGLAHGGPGVIGALARLALAGVAAETARELLAGATRWLLDRELDRGRGFPAWHVAGVAPAPTRLAWCYGDAGVAAAVWAASVALRDDELARHATELAGAAARRELAACGVEDAALCHGAAGVGHAVHRLAAASGIAGLRPPARRWLDRALALRREGEGIAGFAEAWRESGALTWRARRGLLVGAAGVALALLAAVSDVEPAWDRVLLLDLPPRGGAS